MRRGQALLEVAIAAPVLVLLMLLPLAAYRVGSARVVVLEGARERVWAAAAGTTRLATSPPGVQVALSTGRDGRARARAWGAAPRLDLPFLSGPDAQAALPSQVGADLHIYTVGLEVGTEEAGRRAVRDRWLGGTLAAPARGLLRVLLREDPVRVDFAVYPPRKRP